MSLDLAASNAVSGLSNVSAQIATISQNITNASTPGYVREVGTQESLTIDGEGLGVRTGVTVRDVDTALQGSLLAQDSAVSGLQTTQTSLAAIDSVLGTPGSGTDLGSLLGALQDSFTTLADDPSSQPQQAAVVSSAQTLAKGVNQLTQAYATQRQSAQDAISDDVTTLNTTLAGIGTLSDQIVALKAQGVSTADLENQRDAAIQTLAQITSVRVLPQADGDVTLVTDNGLSLPTHQATAPFATSGATLGTGAYYPDGGVPPITLNGQDATEQLTGGSLGADIALRDTTLPAAQAQLDEFAQTLATRFDAQGLTLFTQPDGTVPTATGPLAQSGYVGFASSIEVNPAVVATPSSVRDGTHDVAGAAPFTVNPSTGPAAFSDLISRVLDDALGSQSSEGVAQPPVNITGLGPTGTLTAPYAAPPDLATFASDIIGGQSEQSASATDQLTQQTALQTALTTKLSDSTGVSIDSELANLTSLQNAYGANAKVLTAVQSLWTTLLDAVTP